LCHKPFTMTKRNEFIWNALNVVCWIIFIGYLLQAGTLIFNYIFSVFKPIAAEKLYLQLDLSDVYEKSMGTYMALFTLAIFLSIFKAYLFYLVIKMFMKLNFVKPFSEEVSTYITKISYYTFGIGLLGLIAHHYTKGLIHKGFEVSVIEQFWNSSESYILMSAIVYIIALIFKKGIEIQQEQDLTV
jgi:hypothetical protein